MLVPFELNIVVVVIILSIIIVVPFIAVIIRDDDIKFASLISCSPLLIITCKLILMSEGQMFFLFLLSPTIISFLMNIFNRKPNKPLYIAKLIILIILNGYLIPIILPVKNEIGTVLAFIYLIILLIAFNLPLIIDLYLYRKYLKNDKKTTQSTISHRVVMQRRIVALAERINNLIFLDKVVLC